MPPFTLIYESPVGREKSSDLTGPAGAPSESIPQLSEPVPESSGAPAEAYESIADGAEEVTVEETPNELPRVNATEDALSELRDAVTDFRAAVSEAGDTVNASPELIKLSHDIEQKFGSIPLNPDFRRTLEYTCVNQQSFSNSLEEFINEVEPVVAELSRQAKVMTVALWDLDSRVGNLPTVIKSLNDSQPAITFFELQGAPVPAGLVNRPAYMINWLRSLTDKRLSKADKELIGENMNANDFYEGARVIRKNTGVDYLVGITPYMIAGETEDEVFWNRFSNSSARMLLVSSYGLRDYADAAARPVEAAIALLFIAALAVAINRRLDYHDGPDTGCLVDHNVERSNIVACIRELKIDAVCLKKFEKKNREPFVAMLESLRSFTNPSETAEPAAEEVDYDHWIGELDKISADAGLEEFRQEES
ncbi:MAG: hypothetical protein ABI857_03650 [Acidobacteriota bacterium]